MPEMGNHENGDRAGEAGPVAQAPPVEVTAAILSYNGRKVVPLCLESVLRQTVPFAKVLFVDNASTDGTPEWVSENHPEVEIVRHPVNNGPNPARNLGVLRSPHRLVLLVDDDAVLDERCLEGLMAARRERPEAAVLAPRIVYYDRSDTIQLEGVYMHYLSEAILLNPERRLSEGAREVTPIDLAAGICLLLDREAVLAVGLFDEYYFFGRTDGELTFRLTLAGRKLYAVPGAVCYHRVKERGLGKVFYQVRNRWYLILTTYSERTLLLLAPAFLVYEASLVPFLAAKGHLRDYLRAMAAIVRDLPKVRERRRAVQALRRVPDREVLRWGVINMRGDLVRSRLLVRAKSALDRFFRAYWRLVYPAL